MYQIFFFIALLIGVFPLLILFVKKKALDLREPISLFVWLTTLASLYEFFGSTILKINTTYWWQLYSLMEFVSLYYFFYKSFEPKRKIIFILWITFFLMQYSLSFFYLSEVFISSSINKTPLTLFIIVFSFLWFKELFYKMEIQNPWQIANFYFVSGFLLYYSSTFFLFLLASFLFKSNVYFYDYWLINIVATIILRTSLIIGVWKMKQD